MAKSVNKVILVGNLGKDPEVKYTPSGMAVARFTLATNERYKDKDGNWQDKTEWHNLVAFQRTAEIVGGRRTRRRRRRWLARLQIQRLRPERPGSRERSCHVAPDRSHGRRHPVLSGWPRMGNVWHYTRARYYPRLGQQQNLPRKSALQSSRPAHGAGRSVASALVSEIGWDRRCNGRHSLGEAKCLSGCSTDGGDRGIGTAPVDAVLGSQQTGLIVLERAGGGESNGAIGGGALGLLGTYLNALDRVGTASAT
jgi:primosomal replication protein N